MNAQKTPKTYYIFGAVAGLLIGLAVGALTVRMSLPMPDAPWIISVILLLVGVLVAAMAWQVRRYVTGEIKKMDPQRSVNTLILSKAVALANAVLAGWYAGQFIVAVQHVGVSYYDTVIRQTAVACVVCIIDVVLGILGEWWCTLPPIDGPENSRAMKSHSGKNASHHARNVTEYKVNADHRDTKH